MRSSVVFGVTSRLLVINISSSSPTINTAAYCQRCVTTCETVRLWPSSTGDLVLLVTQVWHVAALTAGIKESRFLPTPPAFDAPCRNIVMPLGVENLQ